MNSRTNSVQYHRKVDPPTEHYKERHIATDTGSLKRDFLWRRFLWMFGLIGNLESNAPTFRNALHYPSFAFYMPVDILVTIVGSETSCWQVTEKTLSIAHARNVVPNCLYCSRYTVIPLPLSRRYCDTIKILYDCIRRTWKKYDFFFEEWWATSAVIKLVILRLWGEPDISPG